MNQFPLIDKTYSILIYIIPLLRKFPKDQRYLLAQRIENNYFDLITNFQKAIYAPPERKQMLMKSNLILENLRILWRLAKDLGFVSLRRFSLIVEMDEEIGRMIGGWLNKLSSSKNLVEDFG